MQCNVAQQDQVAKLNSEDFEHQSEGIFDQAQVVHVPCSAGPFEVHTDCRAGEQWDPGLGWAGFDDPDAEW